jgi:crotonobetainyl-CoA:carnitine CoA-transferase CaiB-like acyl-CoA transferase
VSLLTYMAQYYFISGEVPQRWGAQHENVVPYNAFATADGSLVITAFTEKFWRKLCQALELPELADDPRFNSNEARRQNRETLNSLLAEHFRTRSTTEWLARLQAAGVPAGPIQRVDQVLNDPHILARQMRITVEHPTIGPLPMVGNPIKAADTAQTFSPPPLLGQHTEQVLTELLGYSAEQIAAWREAGVI